MLDVNARGQLDQRQMTVDSGGLLTPIVGEIFENLIRLGVLHIDSTISHRGHTKLIDLRPLFGRYDAHPFHRVGGASALIGFAPNEG